MSSDKGSLIVGLSIPQSQPDAARLLQSAREDGFDFITTGLASISRSFVRTDVTALSGRWWRTSVVGNFTPPDSDAANLASQLEWAIHMGIPAVILPAPKSESLMDYSRVINSLALEAQNTNLQIWIKSHLNEESIQRFGLLHRMCDGISNIGMILVVEALPTMQTAASTVASQIILLHKCIGANLKAVSFPTKIFLTNKRGYPTLAKSHQVLFKEMLKRIGRTVRVLIEGPTMHEIPNAGEGMGSSKCLPYLQYIRHIRQQPDCVLALDSEQAQLESPYLDSLQRPLQPLKDHLEFSMYETFEKDPVKYDKYQEAVFLALEDGLPGMSHSPKDNTVTIVVAGAGRGPLVMRCILAFKQLQLQSPGEHVQLHVYAVEKNPSAVVYLESMARNHEDWQGVVTVVREDARKLRQGHIGGRKIDIIVSELLGSFGDNELSPECLDPLLSSECCHSGTVSIPCQYTAFVAPVSGARLHIEAKQQALVPHEGGQVAGLQRAMETAYVVRTHAASQTHMEQACWGFRHPAPTPNKERVATLEFAPDPTFGVTFGCGYGPADPTIATIIGQAPASDPSPITVHGLLGSFTAILYARGDASCEISIAPHCFSKDMFSWFPIFFPFREPLQVPGGSNIAVKMWRKVREERVWYEWSATVHRKGEVTASTPIHNPNGRSSHVSM